jgi:hypothetical protein
VHNKAEIQLQCQHVRTLFFPGKNGIKTGEVSSLAWASCCDSDSLFFARGLRKLKMESEQSEL